MISLVILVGGKGTRVKKITNGSSKAEILIKKNNKIIDYQLKSLIKLKKNITIISNKKFRGFKDYVNKKYSNSKILIVDEVEQKGTASALKNLPENNKNVDYLIVFGDLLFNFNFNKFLKFHKKKKRNLV